MAKFKFIDLFCGIGGFHQAMTSLGGKCVFACDIDDDCRKTYSRNYGIMPERDVTKIDTNTIPPYDVLCAGFPCQAFSKAGNRLGFQDETKGTLFFDVERIMRETKPKYALLENVRNLVSHDNGNTWRVIYEHLTAVGYNVLQEPVIFSPHYIGIPQHRERVFIMCVRKDIGLLPKFSFEVNKLPKCSIEDILQPDDEIEDLPHYQLSQDYIALLDLWEEFIRGIKVKKLPGFPIWSEYLCPPDPHEDISEYPIWKIKFIEKNRQLYEDNKTFINDWMRRAKECPLFFGAKAKLEWQAGQTDTPSLFDHILQFRPSGIRVKPGTYFPALVAITQTSIVGSRRRYLTPRECARLQSFPDTFIPDTIEAQAYKQLGNAVNVEMVKLFAKYMFGNRTIQKKYSQDEHVESVDFLSLIQEFPDEIVSNKFHEDGVESDKNVLISYVKNDTIEMFLDGSINVYYTGKKFPSTVALNKLYYFMPYKKGKGIRDLYLIKIARVGSKHEVHPECDENDFRLVFEVEFVKQLFDDFYMIDLPIWHTFKDTTMKEIINICVKQEVA
ncbi:MAG: DNA cytosine methyltransferase [Bacteroidaceae bacterium]|nr:DNA cytosine methyltransferase [Bacteroidaceae bacterium]